MAMAITRSVGSTGIPVWQGKEKDMQLAQGGFALAATSLPKDSIIPAGTPIIIDETARTATAILDTGVLNADSLITDTVYKVNKGHTFKVGDNMAAAGTGGKAFAITAIDSTSSTLFDSITVATTLGVVTAGTRLYASSANGATASAYAAYNAMLYDDTLANPGESVSAVIRGTIYANRCPGYSAGLAALTGLSKIIFSQSK